MVAVWLLFGCRGRRIHSAAHGTARNPSPAPETVIELRVWRLMTAIAVGRRTHLKHGRKGNMAEDQQLMCSDCGQAFTFTAEDQEFFRERGYSAPKRCKACRQAKKNEQRRRRRRRVQPRFIAGHKRDLCRMRTADHRSVRASRRSSRVLPELLSGAQDQARGGGGRRGLWQGPLIHRI